MNINSVSSKWAFWACIVLFLGCGLVQCDVVTYDRKTLRVNNTSRILFSGAIHYPRSTPEMWEDLIKKAKFGGLDVIETYVFWNGHEPSPGIYNFEGRYDLVRFIKTIQKEGLYVFLRIGPYVCAEWNFGGFPVWLKFVPGISFRTDNEPFKNAMQSFTQKIVDLMKSENLFASQGGPIILSQIENEYGPLGKRIGNEGYNYMNWAAQMAVGMGTGVPWVMCKQDDAPDPVINTCNGFYCDYFSPNQYYKPKIWTEAWTGWFSQYGKANYARPAKDMAFAVAKFIMKGGSFVNYYMYQGGTNFGRTAGGPFITTSYDYDAPIDEYGLLRQPKAGHLKELHKVIKQCEHVLVSSDPVVTNLGSPDQEAYVYNNQFGCVAFLANYDPNSAVKVFFNKKHQTLQPWSISILTDCTHLVYSTARVTVQTSQTEMVPSDAVISPWEVNTEDGTASDDSSTFTKEGLIDQLNATGDSSDYLWYKTTVNMDSREFPTLIVQSYGHALYVHVNGVLVGSVFGTPENRKCTFKKTIKLQAGLNKIALLSVAVGLPNIGKNFELTSIGVLGPVALEGLSQGKWDLARETWTYQVGLKGESTNLASPNSLSSVEWTQSSIQEQTLPPLTWLRAYFDAPTGDEPVALDMSSMGKGQMWINGQSIGRYWPKIANGSCTGCTYKGIYRYFKCQIGCGKPTQSWYHVPRAWLKPTRNEVVLFEELGGDPTKITLNKRMVTSVCANVAEYHPNFKNWEEETESINGERVETKFVNSKVRLHCSLGNVITAIKFASFGTPTGNCGNFQKGTCDAPETKGILEKKCIGRRKCRVAVAISNFVEDPCPNKLKRLIVEAECKPRK
ncbi:Beta-galactosidase 3 [Castilleja foliolosa]|uniref:Beta-galactosidase n=1 Tax=Castilleja foliolosa TaxID=1961234 RepID=A0ABD3BCT4_9LAMI